GVSGELVAARAYVIQPPAQLYVLFHPLIVCHADDHTRPHGGVVVLYTVLQCSTVSGGRRSPGLRASARLPQQHLLACGRLAEAIPGTLPGWGSPSPVLSRRQAGEPVGGPLSVASLSSVVCRLGCPGQA